MKPPTPRRQRRDYSDAKQSCLWAQTTFLVRERRGRTKAAEPRFPGPCSRLPTTCTRPTALVYIHIDVQMHAYHVCRHEDVCPHTHGVGMLSLLVPGHNHGAGVVLTTVEVTSAAPTMGLTL